MKLWLPIWQEALAFIINHLNTNAAYAEDIYKKLIVKGKKGSSPYHLRRCLKSLEKAGLLEKKDKGYRKPYSLTSTGQEAAQSICLLKQITKKHNENEIHTIL